MGAKQSSSIENRTDDVKKEIEHIRANSKTATCDERKKNVAHLKNIKLEIISNIDGTSGSRLDEIEKLVNVVLQELEALIFKDQKDEKGVNPLNEIHDAAENTKTQIKTRQIKEQNHKSLKEKLGDYTNKLNSLRKHAKKHELDACSTSKELEKAQKSTVLYDETLRKEPPLPNKQQEESVTFDKSATKIFNNTENKQIKNKINQSSPENKKKGINKQQLNNKKSKCDCNEEINQEINLMQSHNSDVQNSVPSTLTEIKACVDWVENVLNNPTPSVKEELDTLDNKLTQAILALTKIQDDQADQEIRILRQVIHWFFVRIQLITTQITESVDDEDPNQLDQQQIDAQTMERIEAKIKKIEPQIHIFVGLETSKKFFELDETLIRSTLKLDDIRPAKGSELHNSKISLLKKIHKYTDILDERVKQTEKIEEFEKQIKDMLAKIESFDGNIIEEERNSFNKHINKLKEYLEKLVTNEQLQNRKENCIKKIDNCLNKIIESTKPPVDLIY